jgi:integrase
MSALTQALTDYLAIRRSLGFTLRGPACLLRDFVAFLEAEREEHITTELALRWAKTPVQAQPATWAERLATARRFAIWRSATDPRTQVPPHGLLPHRYRRQRPYIYTDHEIRQLAVAAAQLPSRLGLRAASYSTLFTLLAVTGMRVSEGLALDRADVDLDAGILSIRRTKFGKSRLVPLHRTTRDALMAYAITRDQTLAVATTQAFFLSEQGARITEWSTRYTFAKISRQVGLRPPVEGHRHGRGPRLHDMRHRFAVQTLIRWYRAGLDVEREIHKLSTYLGHVHVNDTYWYIEAVPELLRLATDRLIDKHGEAGS